jgi:hypothetical protein
LGREVGLKTSCFLFSCAVPSSLQNIPVFTQFYLLVIEVFLPGGTGLVIHTWRLLSLVTYFISAKSEQQRAINVDLVVTAVIELVGIHGKLGLASLRH